MESCKVGKVKKVYKISHQELEFEFTDQTFFSDKTLPDSIPHEEAKEGYGQIRPELVEKTSQLYLDSYQEITGEDVHEGRSES